MSLFTANPSKSVSTGPPNRSALCSRLLVSFVAAVLPACAPASAQGVTARVDSLFSFATAETPGCAVGASRHSEVIVDRVYGVSDVERRVPLTPNAVFDIGSAHKQFVAASVLLLVEDGRLALDDDVRGLLPELPDYGSAVTVDHLLTHTSGVRDWTGLLPMAPEGTDVLELILRQRGLNFEPGTEWSYSNSGYVLLKEIVARVSGMPFADFVRQRVFEPLGMTSSAYVEDVLQYPGERALAYQREGDAWEPHMRLGNERGGGTVVSTAADLLRWNDALTSGRLGAFVTEKLQEPATLDNGRTLTYARGLMVDDVSGDRMVWHSGGAAGYSTWLGRFTESGLSVAVLCNFEPVSATALAGDVSDLFLPPAEAEPPGPVAAEGVDVAGRAGVFLSEAGELLWLVDRGGTLVVAGGGALVPVSKDRFVPQRTSLFFRSSDEFELVFPSDGAFELTSMEGVTTTYLRADPWTPTASDLELIEGRYGSDELSRVFEILPGPDGLVFRFEDAREQAVEAEPVARDLYKRGLVTLRFLRDASGNVVGFDYGNPVVQGLRFTRLGGLAADSPPLPTRETSAPDTATSDPPAAPAPPLADLVGEYEMAPGRMLAITLEDGQLHGQPLGSPKRPLVHVAGATFRVEGSGGPITLTFTLGDDGRATAMTTLQGDRERALRRVER